LQKICELPREPPVQDPGRGRAAWANKIESCYFILQLAVACEVSMADLHHMRTPDPNAGIDTVGWLFLAFACTIIAVAAVIAYEANDTKVANSSVPHIAAR
jgi:hypothetical protein